MTPLERDDLILAAALEWGSDAMYDIRIGTLGPTLYADCLNKAEASFLRKQIPIFWHDLYTVVRYPTHVLTRADEAKIPYDPFLK